MDFVRQRLYCIPDDDLGNELRAAGKRLRLFGR